MCSGMCPKCCGIMKIVTGALLLVNAYVWPKWVGIDGWIAFFAVLMIVFGIVKLLMPKVCPQCAVPKEEPIKKSKK